MNLLEALKIGLPFRSQTLHRYWISLDDNSEELIARDFNGEYVWTPSYLELVADDYVVSLVSIKSLEEFKNKFSDGVLCKVWNDHDNFSQIRLIISVTFVPFKKFIADNGQYFDNALIIKFPGNYEKI